MGKFFKSGEELCEIHQKLFERLLESSEVSAKILALNKNLKFIFKDPNAEITVLLRDNRVQVVCGPCDEESDVKFWLSAESAHRLWLGKVTPTSAIMAREVRASGPISALTDLESIFSKSHDVYRQILKEEGRDDLLR
jgi:alkyl sulfatase BDS1-like metallo-beta-lactamase superfamily hydrolase